MSKRVAVFGDTGGHAQQLLAALHGLGVDLRTMAMPEDLTVVHLGDLIHKGPNSEVAVRRVDELMRRNPGQWLQTLGNHELQHLSGGIDFWTCYCSPQLVTTLEEWQADGLARYAWSIEDILPQKWTAGNRPLGQEELVKTMLLTHAGLAPGFHRLLGSPASAKETAEAINGASHKMLRRAGYMLGNHAEFAPSPVWALSSREVIAPWLREEEQPVFSQAMGHASLYRWDVKSWYVGVPAEVRSATKLLPADRIGVTFADKSALFTLDPDFAGEAHVPTQPYLLFRTS